MTASELIEFENDLAAAFERGEIKSPLHLAGGNENALIEVFEKEKIGPSDWICCAWRSHYHALLKGVPPLTVKQAIHNGRSIALCFPEHRMISSAIVGGNITIAVGLAMAIKHRAAFGGAGASDRVFCFVGDMTAHSGLFAEGVCYAGGMGLPLTFVIEDNGKSVTTDTKTVWGNAVARVVHYNYELSRPHVGIGKFIRF